MSKKQNKKQDNEITIDNIDFLLKKSELELHHNTIKHSAQDVEFKKIELEIAKSDVEIPHKEFIIDTLMTWGFDINTRTILIQDEEDGEVNSEMAYKFNHAMTALESISNEPIKIYLNTIGGSCRYGFSMIDRILNSSCKTHIHASGSIMSMGVYILAAGTTRSASFMTDFMHHIISNTPEGKLTDIEAQLEADKKFHKRMCKYLATRTNKDYDFWYTEGKHVDKFFDADQAKEYGLIDEVL